MMQCEDYLEMLDSAEPGRPLPAAFHVHAKSCARCGAALRLEQVLNSAHEWTPVQRMSSSIRIEILARARAGLVFRKNVADFAGDAFLTAMIVCVITLFALPGVPALLREVVPLSAQKFLAPVLHTLAGSLSGFFAPFADLAGRPEGLALLAGIIFLILFAVTFSRKLLSASPERGY